MMYKAVILFVLACVIASSTGLRTVQQCLSDVDTARYNQVFADGLKSSDLQGIYYSAINHKTVTDAEKKDVCKRLPTLYTDSKLNEFEKNFYLVGTHKHFGCTEKYPSEVDASIKFAFSKNSSTTQEVYFNFFTAKALKVNLPNEMLLQISRNLQLVLKKDDSLSSVAHAFYVAAELGTHGEFAWKRVESTLAQADEVDGKFLQFEGGLSITASVISSIFKLSANLKKEVPLTTEQATKFTAYFLSRRSVQTPKGVSSLLEVLTTVSAKPSHAPVCMRLYDNGKLKPEQALLRILVADVFGKPLAAVPTVNVKIVAKQGNKEIESKAALSQIKAEPTTFVIDLAKYNLAGGHYLVDLDAGTYKTQVVISMLQKVKVSSFEVGVGDVESSAAIKKHTVNHPDKLREVLNADSQQKIVLKVALVDEQTKAPLTVHQVFVRLSNEQTKEEIIFVAEQDSSKAYKFDMDVGARSADFGHKSGQYSMELIVGDALLANSFVWKFADAQLKFAQEPSKSAQPVRKALPEIAHKFREPESRPPRIFSDLFTGLCAAPLLILVVLWLKLRVNVSNFPLSLSALGFHVGLGSIFALFLCFWLKLNMFTTLKYLLPLALFTFLTGNRLLRHIAARRSEK
ncbi:dolichyl-diphosphooligosaccharide--protein glycosyltransferase subunit 2 [Culicoides brevitarsis]|uniref:dolichyl-diphosphooligosaccharide--protein glycosyltransferase subunit 2 n=1 Tax=Culicoides brevitarsis TaxID=469753 RepID=UPI00307CA7EF